jgi:AcrR family transcriptional regulator
MNYGHTKLAAMPSETRDRLLEATWSRVREGGVAAATSRSITSEAAANLGAITYHFGSKDELVAEALVTAIRRLIQPALDALQADVTDPITGMLRALGRLQESLAESAGDAPAYLEALVSARHISVVHEQVSRLFAELRILLADQISRQQAGGSLPAWVDPEPMAGLLLAVAQGVVLQITVEPEGPQQSAMANQFAQLLIASRQTPSTE